MNYESAYQVLPPGTNISPNSVDVNPQYNYGPPYAGPYIGVLVYLLPYMEQGPEYNLIPQANFAFNTTAPAWAYGYAPFDFQSGVAQVNGTGIAPWAQNVRIKSYECPSDNLYAGVTTGLTDAYFYYNAPDSTGVIRNYIAIDYILDVPGFGHEVGRTNYIANNGGLGTDSGWIKYLGPYYDNSKTKLTEISDGTSNTIAFGETLGGAATGARDLVLLWPGSGTMPTAWGLQPDSGAGWYTYSSKHGSVVNFAYCDGSVRPITKGLVSGTPGYTAFVASSGIHDGVVFDYTLLGQ
jgi:prepilin-type processing-associated H-X9-DG protein